MASRWPAAGSRFRRLPLLRRLTTETAYLCALYFTVWDAAAILACLRLGTAALSTLIVGSVLAGACVVLRRTHPSRESLPLSRDIERITTALIARRGIEREGVVSDTS